MANLLKGVELSKNGGGKALAEDVLKNKVVALYFGAYASPPCRSFTLLLNSFHQQLENEGSFEVVYVSGDHSECELKSNLFNAHGNWYYLPFGSAKIEELNKKYAIDTAPNLTIIDADGKVLKKNATEDVRRCPAQVAVSKWKTAA